MKHRAAEVFCAALVGLLSAAGCASDPLPVASSVDVDLNDPDQVIAQGLETMFTWKPTSEASPNTAYKRAAVYHSADLAKQGDNAPEPGPGSQWEQWRADGATVSAKVYIVADETPPNADDLMNRVVVVVQTATTADQKLIDEIRHTAWVTANRSSDGWHITSIHF